MWLQINVVNLTYLTIKWHLFCSKIDVYYAVRWNSEKNNDSYIFVPVDINHIIHNNKSIVLHMGLITDNNNWNNYNN